MKLQNMCMLMGATALIAGSVPALAGTAEFGRSNPFYAPSTLPFQAPPFDKIKDVDYQPAIEAGMAQQLAEIAHIAENPAAPTFGNTFAAMEKSGRLLSRALAAFRGASQANINPTLQASKSALAPKLAALDDAIHLNRRLFERLSAVYHQRASLQLDPEALRLVEVT